MTYELQLSDRAKVKLLEIMMNECNEAQEFVSDFFSKYLEEI